MDNMIGALRDFIANNFFPRWAHALNPQGVKDAFRPIVLNALGKIEAAFLGGIPTFDGVFVDGVLRVRQVGSPRYRSDHSVSSGIAIFNGFDDTGAVYIPVWIDGQYLQFRINGSTIALQISTEGTVMRGPLIETAEGYDNIRAGILAGVPYIILEDAGFTQWEIRNVAGVLALGIPGAARLSLSTAGNLAIDGTITTQGGFAWNLAGYTAGAPAATGHVDISIGGTTYQLLAKV